MTLAEKAVILTLSNTFDSPVFSALSSKFGGVSGDRQKTLERLDRDFPGGEMPRGTDGYGGWGSAPPAIIYVYTMGVLMQ